MLAIGRVYYDISPEITEKLAVFPGDTPFARQITVNFNSGTNYLASSISSTVHLGAHVDAPNHYEKGAVGISERNLDYYLGECQVISLKLAPGARAYSSDLGTTSIHAKRVLFRTDSFPDPNRWNGNFNSLSAELVGFLAERGVMLVGIDTPSIDPSDDTLLETHQAVAEYDLAVLEGIVLTLVPDGIYTLVALPLKLKGADASPVRAILLGESS